MVETQSEIFGNNFMPVQTIVQSKSFDFFAS